MGSPSSIVEPVTQRLTYHEGKHATFGTRYDEEDDERSSSRSSRGILAGADDDTGRQLRRTSRRNDPQGIEYKLPAVTIRLPGRK